MAEKDAKQNELPAPADEEKTVFTQRDLIQFEDFEKVQLVVAKVLKCEKVPKADKLLMSTLKVGDTEHVVVSGIAKFYTQEGCAAGEPRAAQDPRRGIPRHAAVCRERGRQQAEPADG